MVAKRLRAAGLAGLIVILMAGCWYSETPLMPASALDDAPLAARYRSRSGATLTIQRLSRGRYAMRQTDNKGKVENRVLSFDRLGPRSFLVQDDDPATRGASYTQILFREDRRIEQFNFVCDSTVSRLPGVTKDGSDCIFADYRTLVAAARQLSIETIERDTPPEPACDPDYGRCPPMREREAPSEIYFPALSGNMS